MGNDVQNAGRARQLVSELIELTEKAQKKCRSARTWGVFDILGGGTMSTAVKHLKLSSVQDIMQQINAKLSELRSYVSISNMPQSFSMNRGFLATVADFAWDGALSDIWMQTKIKGGLNELNTLHDNLVRLRDQLNRQ